MKDDLRRCPNCEIYWIEGINREYDNECPLCKTTCHYAMMDEEIKERILK